ncbi:MAG: D-tyrosyl-tRNA(Tyr) deacylase [Calditrichaeota bacterium]|nr:MAG: D-tyrosyl-tRNA(Tyr) deacylase [Calditrichota bacterium]
MRALIQRTKGVKVFINNDLHSSSQAGLLVLFGTREGDTADRIDKLADKIVNLRIFEDSAGKMNLSLLDIKGELMVVSQFTLYANTNKGRRPSFNEAQNPADAEKLYERFVTEISKSGLKTASGRFGASMDIHFDNDGPVTILLDTDDY